MKLQTLPDGRGETRRWRWLEGWRRRRGRRVKDRADPFGGLEALEPRILMAVQVIGAIPDLTLTDAGVQDVVALNTVFDDPAVTIVKFESVLGTFHIQLFNEITPLTVQNFLNYVNSGAYNDPVTGDNFIHRSVPDFVVQGGGFNWDGTPPVNFVPTNPPVVNEFDKLREFFGPDVPINIRGTIAMAKQGGDPDSATSQWFFNLADNSENLDNQNGGFTTFGQVLGGGMAVLDAIAAVPRFNAGAPFDNLPLIDFDPAGNIETQHLVRFTDIAIVDELLYAVDNSRPDLLTVTVVDGQLRITNTAQRAGMAHVTITAMDRHGGTAETSFEVRVYGKTGTYVDADGVNVTIALRGDGLFMVEPAADPALGALITMQQTSGRTALTINARGGSGQTLIHEISADGSLGRIVGPRAIVTGDIDIHGSLGMLRLHSIRGPSTITIGAGPAAAVTLRIGTITDLTIDSATPIKSLIATSWIDTDGHDAVNAPRLDVLRVGGDFQASLTLSGDESAALTIRQARVGGAVSGEAIWEVEGAMGALVLSSVPEGWQLIGSSSLGNLRIAQDFEGSLLVTSIRNAVIRGDMLGAQIKLTQAYEPGVPALRALTVRGIVDESTIQAAGDIGKFTAAAFRNSRLFAGVVDGLTTLPASADDFASPAMIGSVTLRGARDGIASFANSQIAASTLRQAKLGTVAVDNGGQEFGLAAQSLARWSWAAEGENFNVRSPDQLAVLSFNDDFIARLV